MFKNREDAAERLLQKLLQYKGQNALVVGIPRGAMPMAKVIADGLQGELNAVLVHKIPAPGQEEFAIGSVGLSGKVFRLPYIKAHSIPESYVQAEVRAQLEKLKKRMVQFHLPPLNCQGRIAILVDDGIATGATVIAAIKELRAQKPKKLILAAGVIPATNANEIKPLVDEFVVLEQPEDFYAVSQFFVDFTQVSDEEVCQLFHARTGHGM